MPETRRNMIHVRITRLLVCNSKRGNNSRWAQKRSLKVLKESRVYKGDIRHRFLLTDNPNYQNIPSPSFSKMRVQYTTSKACILSLHDPSDQYKPHSYDSTYRDNTDAVRPSTTCQRMIHDTESREHSKRSRLIAIQASSLHAWNQSTLQEPTNNTTATGGQSDRFGSETAKTRDIDGSARDQAETNPRHRKHDSSYALERWQHENDGGSTAERIWQRNGFAYSQTDATQTALHATLSSLGERDQLFSWMGTWETCPMRQVKSFVSYRMSD